MVMSLTSISVVKAADVFGTRLSLSLATTLFGVVIGAVLGGLTAGLLTLIWWIGLGEVFPHALSVWGLVIIVGVIVTWVQWDLLGIWTRRL